MVKTLIDGCAGPNAIADLRDPQRPTHGGVREVLNNSERFAVIAPSFPEYKVFDLFGGLESVLQMDGERRARSWPSAAARISASATGWRG